MTTTTKFGVDQVAVRGDTRSKIAVPEALSVGKHRRPPHPSAINQWWVTARTVKSMVKRYELLIAVIAPLIFTIGFYLPLKFVMQLQDINYAQFLMPIIVLQAMAFTSISAAQMSSTESITGF